MSQMLLIDTLEKINVSVCNLNLENMRSAFSGLFDGTLSALKYI